MRKGLLVALCLIFSATAQASGVERSWQIVIDNSAALQGIAEAELFKRRLLYQFSELRKDRDWRDVSTHIVTINNPRNVWVGTPRDLFKQGKLVLASIAGVKNGCADLIGALEQVKLNLELQKPKRVDVIVFSSLIHSGSPCDNVKISLPQEPPQGLELQFIAKHKVRFLWVHHLQVRPWLKAIRKAGLGHASILDEQSTKTFLSKGLAP